VARSRQAILEATRQLLARDGDVGALTVEAVAARARVAKTTVYRRWRDKCSGVGRHSRRGAR
jgi:AcrR family transcriptional regulator